MKLFPIGLITFGVILIVFPDIIAYLLGGVLIVIGINILLLSSAFSFGKKSGDDNYIKVGKYKIYR